jgi:hypothetical protein
MSELNPYVPPASPITSHEVREQKTAQAIGGWLILVAIIVVLSPLRLLLVVSPIYWKIVADGTWTALTTPGSANYNVALATFIAVEALVNGMIFLAGLYLIRQFFSKQKKFPKVFITLMGFQFIIQILDAWIIHLILPAQNAFDPETMAEMGRTVIACAIWIPYMLTSQRVKETFIN